MKRSNPAPGGTGWTRVARASGGGGRRVAPARPGKGAPGSGAAQPGRGPGGWAAEGTGLGRHRDGSVSPPRGAERAAPPQGGTGPAARSPQPEPRPRRVRSAPSRLRLMAAAAMLARACGPVRGGECWAAAAAGWRAPRGRPSPLPQFGPARARLGLLGPVPRRPPPSPALGLHLRPLPCVSPRGDSGCAPPGARPGVAPTRHR